MTLVSETSHKQNHGGNHKFTQHEYLDTINQSKSLLAFRVVVTSLDGINSWSIQTLLIGENDSKQSDEIQAR